MDRTKEFFKTEIHTAQSKSLDADILESLFYSEGYHLTTEEASALLGVTERYLCDTLKGGFDYIVPPKHAKACFIEERISYELRMSDLADLYSEEQVLRKRSRKIFINVDSFKKFMQETLERVEIEVIGLKKGMTLEEIAKLPTKEVFRPVSPTLVDQIFNGDVKLKSLATIKREQGFKYNMQAYRHVSAMELPKLRLVSISDTQPLIRYATKTTKRR